MNPTLCHRVILSATLAVAFAAKLDAVVLPSAFVLAGQAGKAADTFQATGQHRLPEHDLAPEQISEPAPTEYRTVVSPDGKTVRQIPIVAPSPVPIRATDFRSGVYLRAAIGGFLCDDYDAGGFGDQKFASAQISSRAGVRFTGAVGYKFNDWFALEFESGVLYNEIHEVILDDPKPTKDNESGNSVVVGEDDIHDPDQFQVPVMLNAFFFIPTGTRFRPYIGGGVGGMFHWVDAQISDPHNGGKTVDDFNLEIDDFDFAYQAFAGLRYVVTPGDRVNELDPTHPVVEADLGYSWLANDTGAQNHSIMAGLSFLF